MKRVVVGVCFVWCAGMASAQERVPQDQALRAAQLVTEQAVMITDAQLKMEVDTDKPFALRHDEVAGMVIPDKKLTQERLRKAGKDVVPVGQLWLKMLTPVVGGSATPNDKLRIVTVPIDNDNHELPLLLLGVRKGKGDNLELVLYAKDKEPLLSLTLQPVDAQQELPIEFEGKRGDNDTGTIVLNLLGKYQATLPVAKQP